MTTEEVLASPIVGVALVIFLIGSMLFLSWALARAAAREDVREHVEDDPAGVAELVAAVRAHRIAEGHLVSNPSCRFYNGSAEWSFTEECPACEKDRKEVRSWPSS